MKVIQSSNFSIFFSAWPRVPWHPLQSICCCKGGDETANLLRHKTIKQTDKQTKTQTNKLTDKNTQANRQTNKTKSDGKSWQPQHSVWCCEGEDITVKQARKLQATLDGSNLKL